MNMVHSVTIFTFQQCTTPLFFSTLNTKVASTASVARAPHLVEVTELPEEDQQLLVELDLLGGARQVRLDQRVVEQPSQTFEDEAQVLVNTENTLKHPEVLSSAGADGQLRLPLLCGSWRDNSQRGFQVQLTEKKGDHLKSESLFFIMN